MNETATQVIAWILGISLFMLFVVPLAFWAVGRYTHRRRRSLERSRRQIMVAPTVEEGLAKACPHKRSKSRAKADENGQLRSICRFCGVPMLRHGPGDWEVLAPDGDQPG